MKKAVLFIVVLSLFSLVIPGTSLFADIGLGGRIDAGLNMLAFPTSSIPIEDEVSIMPVLPLIDLGSYGQLKLGALNLGMGIRGVSLIVINVFWPSVYAELNIWRFTLNAQVGGGAIYLFPIYMIAGPYFVPELSLWYTITTFNKTDNLRVGLGALTFLSPWTINQEFFQDISNNMVFYIGIKVVINQSWMTWKRDL
jgi:hypothetical protein